jgi:hypothetical protein
MTPVVIETPYAGDVTGNLAYLWECCKDALSRGESPYASHGFFTQFLDDTNPEERKTGIEAGFVWGALACTRVFYVDLGVSSGMRKGFEEAIRLKQRIVIRSLRVPLSDVLFEGDQQ